jgi:hypothetical protein
MTGLRSAAPALLTDGAQVEIRPLGSADEENRCPKL